MKVLNPLTLSLAMTLLLFPPALAQTGHDLFQQALVKEQADGDLRAAISLYDRIVREFSADGELAARALVQMGQCYERLGSQEARNAYQQVLDRYPGESEWAERARARLVALSRPAPMEAHSEIQVRRLMSGRYPTSVEISGGPTPNGRSLVYTDWETLNLAVRDLETGASRRITTISEDEYETGYPGYALVSPGGDRLAYTWHRTGQSEEGSEGSEMEIRVIGMDGSNPRAFPNQATIWPECWSKSGEYLAGLGGNDGDETAEVFWIDVEDGSMTSLGVFDVFGRSGIRMSPSPTDRFLAFDHPVLEDSARFDVSLIATDGTGIRPLINHPADDHIIGWVPGTDDLLFKSTRSGEWDLWAIRVDEDGRASSPRPVRRGIGEMDPMGFTRDGSLFYSVYTLQYNLSVVPFDDARGMVRMGESEALGGRGSNMRPSWSPDGNLLAFVRRRPSSLGKTHTEFVYVRDMRTGEERALAEHIAPATVGAPVWFPDGRSLLVLGTNRGRTEAGDQVTEGPAAYRVDVATGQTTPLFEFPPDTPWGTWVFRIGILPASDGQAVIYSYDGRLVRRELNTGQEVELYRDPLLVSQILALSPDGSELAFGVNVPTPGGSIPRIRLEDGGSLMLVPARGGEAREIWRMETPGRVGGVNWSSDGSALFFGLRDPEGTTLVRVNRGSGALERLQEIDRRLRGLSLSPDGGRMAYYVQTNEAEVWVMENLVEALAETQGR